MIRVTFEFDYKSSREDFYRSWLWKDYLERIVNLGRCLMYEVKEVDD